jgi:hypothetical protein
MKRGLIIVLTTIVFASTAYGVQKSVMLALERYSNSVAHNLQVKQWGMYAEVYSR